MSKMVHNELSKLVQVFPEIELQVELLTLRDALEKNGVIATVRHIKESYGEMAEAEVIIYCDAQITHMTISQLVSKILLAKSTQDLQMKLSPENCRQALWEKVNSSILSRLKLTRNE